MKALSANLLDDVVSVYDQTKTTIQGRVLQKTINSQTVLGPPLNRFVDVFTDSGMVPAGVHITSNGRKFVVGTLSAGVMPILCYTFNTATGAYSYVGRINLTTPNSAATTHTVRSLKVLDTGTTGWKIWVITTGTVTINGGTFSANKIDLADFVPIGFPTIPFATGNDQKAVYFHQDAANVGVSQLQIASAGAVMDKVNNRLYVHNGIAATHQYYVYDTSIAPTYVTNAVTGSQATDTITDTGHAYAANTPIVFTSLTGGAGLTVGTVYFVRNPVAGVSYELSATSGGALLNFTTDITAGTVGRAFGTSVSNFLYKTGNLPALTGTLLLIDSEDYAEPSGVNVAVDGFPCAFFGTTSNMYLGRLSELTVGAITWPSLQTVNLLGTTNQTTAVSATHMAWSNVLNKAVYVTNTSIFVLKSFVNNSIDAIFGGLNNRYLETLVGNNVVELGMVTVTGIDLEDGWFSISTGTIGQRGVYLADLRSEALFDYSYIVTKVLDTPQSVYKFITTIDELYDSTGSLKVDYRTSGFGSISGGWAPLPFAEELSGYAAGDQFQAKIRFTQLGLDACIPAQLVDFILGLLSNLENSDHWSGDHENSTKSVDSPAFSAAILEVAYPTTVPALAMRGYARSTGSLVIEKFTDTDAAEFKFSSNSGLSWSALGVIPNTINTTRVRYEWSTPIPTDVDIVWQEK